MADTQKPNIPKGASRLVPPLWLLASILVMLAIWYWVPGTQIIPQPFSYVGWAVFAAAVGLAIYGKKQFDHVGTGVRPFTEITALVVSGPFRFSRNPMYLAMVIGLIGVGVILGKIAPFVVVPLFTMWLKARYIGYEEQLMEAHFGEDYVDYKGRVRRWF